MGILGMITYEQSAGTGCHHRRCRASWPEGGPGAPAGGQARRGAGSP